MTSPTTTPRPTIEYKGERYTFLKAEQRRMSRNAKTALYARLKNTTTGVLTWAPYDSVAHQLKRAEDRVAAAEIFARLPPLTPDVKYDWEIARDEKRALEARCNQLELRNVTLEQLVDQLQDEIADLKAKKRTRR